MSIELIPDGHVMTPQGFVAGAVCAGMYASGPKHGELDLGILFSERECASAGVLTQNTVRAAPVYVNEKRLPSGNLRGVITNSGNANAPFGLAGIPEAEEMAGLAARKLGVPIYRNAIAAGADHDVELWVRATDSKGRAQPHVAGGWNPQGYGANPMHRVAVLVG